MNYACSITIITFVSTSTSHDLSIYSIKGCDDFLLILVNILIYLFICRRSSMSSANAIVQYLLDTRQQTAVGIGHLLQALLNAAKPPAKPPIIIEHMNKEGTTRVMMFSRQKLSTTFYVSPGKWRRSSR